MDGKSKGADEEVAIATQLNIPTFTTLPGLYKWAAEAKRKSLEDKPWANSDHPAELSGVRRPERGDSAAARVRHDRQHRDRARRPDMTKNWSRLQENNAKSNLAWLNTPTGKVTGPAMAKGVAHAVRDLGLAIAEIERLRMTEDELDGVCQEVVMHLMTDLRFVDDDQHVLAVWHDEWKGMVRTILLAELYKR